MFHVFESTFSASQQVIKGRCSNRLSRDSVKTATLQSISHKALSFEGDALKYSFSSADTIKQYLRQFLISLGFV